MIFITETYLYYIIKQIIDYLENNSENIYFIIVKTNLYVIPCQIV